MLWIAFSFLLGINFSFAQDSLTVQSKVAMPCDCESNNLEVDSTFIVPGSKILETGHRLAIVDQTVIRGSCWDFVNEIYRIAGFANTKKTVFRSKKSGPYAPATMVKPGDWIYHINHSFNNIEHSAIFVCWKDFKKRIAVTLSYSGMNRLTPGKYGEYKLSSIYSIFRPYFADNSMP